MASIEELYELRVREMSPIEKLARSESLFRWTRETIARTILKDSGPLSESELKWRVALRQYESDPVIRRMIEEKLRHVSA